MTADSVPFSRSSALVEAENKLNRVEFPSSARRGGCAVKKAAKPPYSAQTGAKRERDSAKHKIVVRSAKVHRPEDFAGLTTPSAALRLLRIFLLMPQPPLLFKEYPQLSCVQPSNSKKQAPDANKGLTGAVS